MPTNCLRAIRLFWITGICFGIWEARGYKMETGRRFIGIEIDKYYFGISENRIKSYLNDNGTESK